MKNVPDTAEMQTISLYSSHIYLKILFPGLTTQTRVHFLMGLLNQLEESIITIQLLKRKL